jgi:DNA-binding NarL/FixJ family response regulator
MTVPIKNIFLLSRREVEVLEHVSRDLTNQEIGKILNLRPATVSNHVTAILQSTGARTRLGAVLLAIEHHIIPFPEVVR